MRGTPAYWTGSRWLVHSQASLTAGQLQRIGAWLRKVQQERRLGLAPGDARDDLDASVRALDAGKIYCGLTPELDGRSYEPFKATHGTGNIISLGAR